VRAGDGDGPQNSPAALKGVRVVRVVLIALNNPQTTLMREMRVEIDVVPAQIAGLTDA